MRAATKSNLGSEIRGPGLCWILLVAALLSFSAMPAKAEDPPSAEAQELVNKARLSFESLLRDPNMTWFRDHLKDAKGLLIVPQLLKAAFFVGGSGGSGVLLARDEKTGEWSEPAFYTLGSGSFGLQFGAQASEVVLLVMTKRGVEAMLTSTLKLGGDVSVAIGPVGGGVEGATANLSADILSFARPKGLFAGLSLEGAVVAPRDDWNSAYYGKAVRPLDILMNRSVSNSHSAELRAAIGKATSGK
jgi:lipid-binding SYLF domain-containing protein